MFKNLMTLLLLALFGLNLAHAKQPADTNKIAERKAIYQAWLADLQTHAAKSQDGLFKQTADFLQHVAFAFPRKDGKVIVAEAKEGDLTTVLVLLTADRRINKKIKEVFDHGNISASFDTHGNFLMLRAIPMAPKARALLLGHEGFHAMALASSGNPDQTDEEYCEEEAVAHRMEIEVLWEDKNFRDLVESRSIPIAKKMVGNTPINFEINVRDEVFEPIFGKPLSDIDARYRLTMLGFATFVDALKKRYPGDEGQIMGRFANHLCNIYKEHGIR
jgi:hypothetical protein